VFSSLTEKHSNADIGVFFCGPPAISRALHTKSNEYSTPGGTRFYFGKGEFHFRPSVLDSFAFCTLVLRVGWTRLCPQVHPSEIVHLKPRFGYGYEYANADIFFLLFFSAENF
jgi:hypothetical protein